LIWHMVVMYITEDGYKIMITKLFLL